MMCKFCRYIRSKLWCIMHWSPRARCGQMCSSGASSSGLRAGGVGKCARGDARGEDTYVLQVHQEQALEHHALVSARAVWANVLVGSIMRWSLRALCGQMC